MVADETDLARAGVSDREREVLGLVGEHLQNREIAGRLFLSERTVESHVSSLLRKLGCSDRRALARLATDVDDTPGARAPLPVPLTSFVGRDGETSVLHTLTGQHRLVTIVGPAGCGKTRVALRVAAEAVTRPQPVYVDLAAVAAGAAIEPAFGDALRIRPDTTVTREDVLDALAAGSMFLLVDNCEHVLDAAASLLADALGSNPGLNVLATSQAPLNIASERVFALAPLPVPEPSDSVSAVLDTEAGRLFVERAVAAAPGFRLDEHNAAEVGEICRRLDGLPLALELAAARVRHFSPAEIGTLLDQRFALLRDAPRGSGARQLTLEESLRWSYDLLDHDERLILDRCSVFPGEFGFDSLVGVVSAPPLDENRVTALFPRLLDRSLVARRRLGGASTYRLLESVREYAAARLDERGGSGLVRDRYASFFLLEAGRLAPELLSPRQVETLAWFDRHWPDLRRAVRLTLDRPGGPDEVWHLLAGVGLGWEVLGARPEVVDWIRDLLPDQLPAPTDTTPALTSAAQALCYQDMVEAMAVARMARAAADPADPAAQAATLLVEGLGLRGRGHPDAVPTLADAVAAGARTGDPWLQGYTLVEFGIAHEDLDAAAEHVTRGTTLLAAAGDLVMRSNALGRLGMVAVRQRLRPVDARSWLDQAAELGRRSGSQHELLHAELGLALLARYARGSTLDEVELHRLADEFRRIGDRRCQARSKLGLALAAAERGDTAGADRLRADTAALLHDLGDQGVLSWMAHELV